jgi:anti-anti-sigma factor
MAHINISVAENNTEEQLSVVEIEGVIDTVTVPELEKVLDTLAGISQRSIIINMAAVEYVSLAGWSALIANASFFKEHGGYLCLAGMIQNVLESFLEFEFDRIIELHDNINVARRAVAEHRESVKSAR